MIKLSDIFNKMVEYFSFNMVSIFGEEAPKEISLSITKFFDGEEDYLKISQLYNLLNNKLKNFENTYFSCGYFFSQENENFMFNSRDNTNLGYSLIILEQNTNENFIILSYQNISLYNRCLISKVSKLKKLSFF